MVTMFGMRHSDSQIIDRLGGNAKVAAELKISSQAVSKWRNEGIPEARLMYLRIAHPQAFDTGNSNQQQAA